MTLVRFFGLGVFLTTLATLADASSITFLGTPTSVNDGNYYVLPYQVTIDGTPQLVVCYDIYDDVRNGDTWQAQLLTINQASTSGFFSSTNDALAKYQEIAWLDAQPYHNTAEQIGLQYAIWNVFGTYRSNTQSQIYTAAADAAAATGYAGFDFTGVRFIEQVGGVVGRSGTEQAFVFWQQPPATGGQGSVATPEPGTALLTIFGAVVALLTVSGMNLAVRTRRLLRVRVSAED